MSSTDQKDDISETTKAFVKAYKIFQSGSSARHLSVAASLVKSFCASSDPLFGDSQSNECLDTILKQKVFTGDQALRALWTEK